ncbi:MAG: UDP-N-acetylglucosamine pyrophosphorylase [Bacteroidetes bacterium GWF2_33_16]|nr:MAG: UDP-N-acetylglucosamine pyrophosphorylase [Bacteroidetes bacterium GWE2_32_14]OFY03672.1 MAG: UDP-N-acetylglucosamine pyrophosphorylase [Bacteroidetes bacterium GWF2_33_16]
MKIVILAAGIGSRLGNPFPKPLTPLKTGKTIMEQQINNLSAYFNFDDINIVVGFKKELIMESLPNATFIYNQFFDQTNTSKSLLKTLKKYHNESVLWLNGDVVFDKKIFELLIPYINKNQSFVSVNNSEVGEEEVKYTLDTKGFIKEISKTVKNGLGEAVGINFISSKDINFFIKRLEECANNDYFEKGLEMAIQLDGIKVSAIDISRYSCVEVDFAEDLEKANKSL